MTIEVKRHPSSLYSMTVEVARPPYTHVVKGKPWCGLSGEGESFTTELSYGLVVATGCGESPGAALKDGIAMLLRRLEEARP